MEPTGRAARLRDLDRNRWRVVLSLTGAMVLLYFGFLALVAFGRPILGRLVIPGLSLGILLGAVVIVTSWLLTWVYVWWANNHYDPQVQALSREAQG
jgi:uncharacterized membrane protein (DUF485 family)